MKKLLFFLCLLFTVNSFGQIKPNDFPVDNTPSDTDAFYTQEGDVARKILLPILRNYYAGQTMSSSDVLAKESEILDILGSTILPVYNSDQEAFAGGVGIDRYYRLGSNNVYGLPTGQLRRRRF